MGFNIRSLLPYQFQTDKRRASERRLARIKMKAALKETDYCTEMCGYVNIWAPYLQDGKGNPRTVLRGLSHAINRSLKFPNGKWNSGNPLGVLSRFHKAPREIGTYTRRKKDMAKKLAII